MKSVVFFVLIALLLPSCNSLNEQKTITIKNASGSPQTFSLHDSLNESVIRVTDTIADNEIKSYSIEAGYKKSEIKYCYWRFVDNIWQINKQPPVITALKNNLPIDVTLKDYNDISFSIALPANGVSVSFDIYGDDNRSLYLDGQSTDTIQGFKYLAENGKFYLFFTKNKNKIFEIFYNIN